MMGREKRSQLLVPSFVFVAAAATAACGGTSIGEEEGAAGASGGQAGVGGAWVTTNPPPISYGGQITNPPPISYGGQITSPPPIDYGGAGSGGYGNEAGSIMNPPPVAMCPATVPVIGSACSSAATHSSPCTYVSGHVCNTRMAWCENGVWLIRAYAITCSAGASGN